MSVGGDDDRCGGDSCEAKKAKRARLADEEWDRAVLTKPEWGGHKNTCVEFKKYVGGLGGVGNGYKPLATRYSKKEKPLSMFSQQYRKFMSKLFEMYGDEGVDDPRLISGAAHQAGWRHNHSEPTGVGADKGTGGGSHNHRFYPPEAAKAMVPGLKIKAKGLTTGQALSVLVQMFEE